MTNRFHLLATGTNSTLTLATFLECVHAVNWTSVLTFLGTAVMTGISWYVSIRQSKREQDRLDREETRQQRLEDVLQELKIRQAEADQGRVAIAAAATDARAVIAAAAAKALADKP